jgi:WD40 repeat protein
MTADQAHFPQQLEIRATLGGHKGEIFDLAFSDDETLVSGSGDGTVWVWDSKTGKGRKELAIESFDYVLSVSISSKRGIIAAGTASSKIRLWRTEDGVEIKTAIPQNWGAVQDLAFSPDGQLLAIAAGKKTLRIWDIAANSLKAFVPIKQGNVGACVFASDGQFLLVGTSHGSIVLVDVKNWSAVREGSPGHKKAVTRISLARRGSLAATTDGTEVVIWKVGPLQRTNQVIRPPGSNVSSIALSADGRMVATGLGNEKVALWNTATAELLLGPLPGHGTSYVSSLAFSADGQVLASGGGDAKVLLWSAK